MPLNKDQKKEIVNELTARLAGVKSIIFTDYHGLKVNEIQVLRRKLREKNIEYKVLKTTLIKKSMEANNLIIDESIYSKPLAIAISSTDEVEPSKAIFEFSKEKEKLEILGAIVNGEFYDVAQVKALAKMPTRDELYAKLVGSISAPLSGFVNVLSGNLRGLVSVLKQYQESKKS
jgi:large subunit ribosomal protein L10